MKTITQIRSREILDSRGLPTVETTVWSGKISATASVPSGASTGSHEALELRDGDSRRYAGKGVLKACGNVNNVIAKKMIGMTPSSQEHIDKMMLDMDGTKNKTRLGANAILSVSLAACKLAAILKGRETYQYLADKYGYTIKKMPVPLFNVINGGAHADFVLDVQEFFLIPQKGSFAEMLRRSAEVYQILKKNLKEKGFATSVGDEGGFAPRLKSNEQGLEELAAAITKAGFSLGKDFRLGVDAASSEFYDAAKDIYNLKVSKKKFTSETMYKMYQEWVEKYHLQIIEDGCGEDDFVGWRHLTDHLSKKTTLVGDDLFVTNTERLQKGIDDKIANAILIKVNQIGTLTETLSAIKLAQANKYKVVVSHRSGETNDDFIADLAVAVGADFTKFGSLSRGERLAKYNRLLEIETQLSNAKI
jgi:enolase